jgi:GGDEF domain-containing protein
LGQRADTAARISVGRCLQEGMSPTDRLSRATRDSFVVVLAGCDEERLLTYCRAAVARTADLVAGYPFTPLRVVAGAIVSQRRPLPVEWLQQQVQASDAPPGSVALFTD